MMTTHELSRLILSAIIVLGFFALVGITLFVPIQGYELQIVDMLIGALVASFTNVVAYFFRGQ